MLFVEFCILSTGITCFVGEFVLLSDGRTCRVRWSSGREGEIMKVRKLAMEVAETVLLPHFSLDLQAVSQAIFRAIPTSPYNLRMLEKARRERERRYYS
jgi:hypothetical protein